MMDTSTPNGFYHQYCDRLIRLVFRDGREWDGIVTGVAGFDKWTRDPHDATVVIFTRIKWLKGYYRKIPFFRGRKKRITPDEVAEIHQLIVPEWARKY
jgi:hypothetical protein